MPDSGLKKQAAKLLVATVTVNHETTVGRPPGPADSRQAFPATPVLDC